MSPGRGGERKQDFSRTATAASLMLVSEAPLSVTKVTASIGGALLAASFFLPLVNMREGGAATADAFGVAAMQRQIEGSREYEAVRPLIAPAMQQLEAFGAAPSLRNLTRVIGATGEIVDLAASAGLATAETKAWSSVLAWTHLALWLVPLVGAVQAVLPLLTRFRGHAGFIGLMARFGFGAVFVMLAGLPVLGAPEARPFLGPAVHASLFGGGLMMASGIAGVTRRNFALVFAAQVGLLAAVVLGLRAVVEAAQRTG